MLFGGLQELGRSVHMPAALRFAPHLDAAQNLRLQRRPEALDLLQAPLAGGFFKLRERAHAKLPVKLEDFVWPQSPER